MVAGRFGGTILNRIAEQHALCLFPKGAPAAPRKGWQINNLRQRRPSNQRSATKRRRQYAIIYKPERFGGPGRAAEGELNEGMSLYLQHNLRDVPQGQDHRNVACPADSSFRARQTRPIAPGLCCTPGRRMDAFIRSAWRS